MLEIERKFLVASSSWQAHTSSSVPIEQGYMCNSPTVRVRRYGDQGFLTIKGPTQGISRAEFEYEIDPDEAQAMLDTLCLPGRIKKVRHILEHAGKEWVIDEFALENQGLVLAEIELSSEDEQFERPDWVGEEVSDDPRYFNSALARTPFSTWG